jgi:flagellar protein FlaG
MLIQNTSSVAPAPTPIRLAGSGDLAGVGTSATASPDTPKVAVKEVAVQTPNEAQIKSEVNKINQALQQSNKNVELSISVDKATNKQVIRLVDKDTGDTLMQYPNEAVLAIARGIDEFQNGLLLRQKA